MNKAVKGICVVLLLFLFVGFVLYPLAMTIRESLLFNGTFSLEHYRTLFVFSNAANWEAVWNSVWVSLLSVIASCLVGGVLALVVTQFDFPFRRWLERLAVLPIALPPLVGVIAFLFVFGESGILPRGLQMILNSSEVPFMINGKPAIIAIHAYSFNVYFFLFLTGALRSLDGSLVEASRGLGAHQWRTMIRVVLPQLRPALTGAAVLTFMASMASFSAPLLFGGETRFMTLQMYNAKLNGDMEIAAAQAISLTLVSVLFFVLLRLSANRDNGVRTKGAVRSGTLGMSGLGRAFLISLGILIIAIELLPMLTIILISFAREGSWTWQLLPSEYTVENYMKLAIEPQGFVPIGNSLLMGGLTLVAAFIMAPAIAYMLSRMRPGRRLLLDMLVTLPFALPGTVVALSLILAFNSPTIFTANTVLVGTFWILPLAYVIRTYPLVVRSTSAALQQLDNSLIEAGKGLGAGASRRFFKIVMPVILPGIIAGAVLTLIAALGEFVSSVLLYSYSSRPISIEILAQLRGYNFGAAAAYCVLLLLLILFLTAVSNRLLRRTTASGQTSYF